MTAVVLPFNPILFHQVSHTSCHFHGCRTVVQCSRVDHGHKKEQTVPQVCWQAGLPSWGLPVGYLQTFLEVENNDMCQFLHNDVMEIYYECSLFHDSRLDDMWKGQRWIKSPDPKLWTFPQRVVILNSWSWGFSCFTPDSIHPWKGEVVKGLFSIHAMVE